MEMAMGGPFRKNFDPGLSGFFPAEISASSFLHSSLQTLSKLKDRSDERQHVATRWKSYLEILIPETSWRSLPISDLPLAIGPLLKSSHSRSFLCHGRRVINPVVTSDCAIALRGGVNFWQHPSISIP